MITKVTPGRTFAKPPPDPLTLNRGAISKIVSEIQEGLEMGVLAQAFQEINLRVVLTPTGIKAYSLMAGPSVTCQ